jgi:hypothetical protein
VYSLVERSNVSEEHSASNFHPEDEGSRLLQNISTLLPDYTASDLRILLFIFTDMRTTNLVWM